MAAAGPQRGYARLPSALYDRFVEPGTVRAAAAVLDEVARTAPRGGAVLDVGCGGGRALAALAQRRPDLHLVGADPSAALVAAASARGPAPGAAVLRGSATDLPFATGAFDVVLSLFALKHWPDRRRGLAECARVTREGGRVVVAELRADAGWRDWRRFIDLTDVPRPLVAPFVTATLGPVVHRGVSAQGLSALMDAPALTDVVVEPDPRLALVRASARRTG